MNDDEKEQEDKAPQDAVSAKLMEYAIKARKVFITGVVDERMAKDVVQQLHILSSINEDPIYVFINSPGGHVESGDMIFDAIRFISAPVVMIGSGSVASAGALIYAAAKKKIATRCPTPGSCFINRQAASRGRRATSRSTCMKLSK